MFTPWVILAIGVIQRWYRGMVALLSILWKNQRTDTVAFQRLSLQKTTAEETARKFEFC